jgi:hypothetical protein
VAVCLFAAWLIVWNPSPPPAPAPGYDFPDAIAHGNDRLPPRVADGLDPTATVLGAGRQSVLFFARPDDAAGRATAALAADVHRRMREWVGHVDVVLVVPRDWARSPDEAAAVLAQAGVTGDVRVYLDPDDRERARRGLGAGSHAVLVRDGKRAMSVSAGVGRALSRAAVVGLFADATKAADAGRGAP